MQCDPATVVLSRGRVLLGGSPLRLLTLSAAGSAAFGRLRAGHPIIEAGPGAGLLARRLADAGLAHPVPPSPPRAPSSASSSVSSAAARDAVGDAAGDGAAGRITAVIPARDGADQIAALVAGLRADCAEVVVVDDGSRDGTAAAAAAAGARVVRHDRPLGPAAARLAGARAAGSDLIVFCDCDVRPTAGWLDRLVPHFADPAVAAVAPRVASPVPPGPVPAFVPGPELASGPVSAASRRWARASTALRLRYEAARSPLDLGPAAGGVRAGSRISYVPTAALVIRRDLVAFDLTMRFGEDVDLIWRLGADGHTVRYEPSAVVHHRPRPSWPALARQRFGYGSSAAPLARRHPGPLRPGRGVTTALIGAGVLAARRDRTAVALAAAVAMGSAAVTTARLTRRLAMLPEPGRTALALTLRGRRYVGEAAADTARRSWLPALALAGPPGRAVLLAAALGPPARDWWVERPDVGLMPYLILRFADDAAYCAGVWWGCLRTRTLEPLLPACPGWLHRRRVGGRGTPEGTTEGTAGGTAEGAAV